MGIDRDETDYGQYDRCTKADKLQRRTGWPYITCRIIVQTMLPKEINRLVKEDRKLKEVGL